MRQQAIKGIKIATNRFWIRECLHVFLGVGVKCASARVSLDWKVIVPKPQYSKQFLTIQGVWIVKFHLSSVEFRRFKPFIISRGIGKHSSHNTSLKDCYIFQGSTRGCARHWRNGEVQFITKPMIKHQLCLPLRTPVYRSALSVSSLAAYLAPERNSFR